MGDMADMLIGEIEDALFGKYREDLEAIQAVGPVELTTEERRKVKLCTECNHHPATETIDVSGGRPGEWRSDPLCKKCADFILKDFVPTGLSLVSHHRRPWPWTFQEMQQQGGV
tara:strand:+ start:451 stop:792 length:342 start_codon:yes stop_codon:yes gene_type:complete